MATNQILPFALAGGAYVLNYAAYNALAKRLTGYPPGLLLKEDLNTPLRQAAFVCSAISQVMSDLTGEDVLDNGIIADWITVYKKAERILAGYNFRVDTGVADAYALVMDPVLTAYTNGMGFRFLALHDNTGPSTLNAGPGAVPIKRSDGAALQAGDITTGQFYDMVYDQASGHMYLTSLVWSQFGPLVRVGVGAGLAIVGGNLTSTSSPTVSPLTIVDASQAVSLGEWGADTRSAGIILTLWPTPLLNDNYRFMDPYGTWGTNQLTLDRNGNTIMGLAEDLICNVSGEDFDLIYDGTTWRLQ